MPSVNSISRSSVSSSSPPGRHSAYSQWQIGRSIPAGSVCSTSAGVNGDSGGVSPDPPPEPPPPVHSGLFERYGDNGGHPLGWRYTKSPANVKMLGRAAAELGLSDAFRLESDVEMLVVRNVVNGSGDVSVVAPACGFMEADRQLNELDRLLASFEGRWKSSSDGDMRSFGDRRNEEEVRHRVAVGVVDAAGGTMEILISAEGEWLCRFGESLLEADVGDCLGLPADGAT